MTRAAIWKVLGAVVSFASGEWFLKFTTNGGTVVVIRAAWTALILFLVALCVSEVLRPDAEMRPDWARTIQLVGERIYWYGAIFAAAYAALYARFASQWTYLAGLYNEIMSAQARNPKSNDDEEEAKERRRVYANWMAGFIEDADNLHLALKPIYASLIQELLKKDDVRSAYVENTTGGKYRLAVLEAEVAEVAEWESERQQQKYKKWLAKQQKTSTMRWWQFWKKR